jgi:hypothetical protein
MRHIKSKLAILSLGVGLALSPSAFAQIGYLNGPSPIEYSATAATLNNATFTVSPGAKVLVVFYGSRTQATSPGSDPGTPTTMSWNGNALTRAVSQGSTASTYDDNAIYYLMNPPAGTGSMTSTTIPASENQIFWMAYTLTNVSTITPLLTGTQFTTSGGSINNTIANVVAGDWAAYNTSVSAAGVALALTISPTSGTVLPNVQGGDGNCTQNFGAVSNCPAGSLEFISTAPGQTTAKIVLIEAIFTPSNPPPPAPTLGLTTGNPAQVDLSWTEAANSHATSFIVMRGTNSSSVFTDYTNVLGSTATSYIDANVASGTTYYYTVGAANSSGTNFSTTNSATPVGTPFPPLLGAGASGVGNINLHWTASFGATNYILKRATTSGGETQLATLTNNTYADTGLTGGTAYYYEVEAVGVGGTSGPSDEAKAIALESSWYLFDNFSLDTVNAALNGQTGSAGLGLGWTNLGGGAPITVTNSSTFGGANYAQYAPNAPTSIGDYEGGLGIASNSTAATVFLEFSLPGIQATQGNAGLTTASNLVAMNFDIDNSSPPGALTGSSATGPSAQFNYDNSTGDGFFRVNGAGTFYYATISPTNTPYLPIPGNVYYFWFVINAEKATYQVYLADGSETGTNVDSSGLGATPTLMWGNTASNGVGTTFTYGFRNVSSGGLAGQPVNIIGTGPGSTLGSVPQNEFANIYVDPFSQNLTNPVTGGAATGTPQVLLQPVPVELFAGETATFTIVGSAGVNYQWQSNGVAIVNGGKFSGATTATLTISNVTAATAANYSCVINNPATSAFASSTPAALTIVAPNGAFETAVAAAGPSHFYAFNDTGNPNTGTEVAYDYAGADNGIYGANAANGSTPIYGPTSSSGFPGFPANNYAVQFAGEDEPNNVTIQSPWNLNTNSVTITAWINPATSYEPSSSPIVLNRGSGTDVEGLIYNTSANLAPVYDLGYNWNDDANTTSWDSGLLPPPGQWSFVALTVTPTNATISMMNVNGVYSSTHVYPHPVAPFAGTTMIGDDPASAIGALTFNGIIDEVGIFNQALSQGQLQTMFADASGLSAFAPTNTISPVEENLYPGQTAAFSSIDEGSVPMTYTWQINGVNLTDGPSSIGTIYGSSTPDLTITNLAAGDAGQTYNVGLLTSNAFGSYTNGPPVVSAAVLNVLTPNPPQTIDTTEIEPQGMDWNTAASWSDGNPASVSVYSEPGSTYYVVPGTEERSPASTNAVFPGNALVIEGNGVLLDGNAASFATQTTTGELRLKESGTATGTNFGTVYTEGGTITFPDLQLNGGQIDNGNSSVVVLNGEIDVETNSSIYSDSAAAGSIRSYQINAWLTGTGTITYSFLGTASYYTSNDLVISGTSNTFSGQWIVQEGALVGNAPNSLGTNSIQVSANGALETTYNYTAPNAVLILNGQMYLYTTDTVYSLILDGSNVPPGTYSFAQLNSARPANFPATWPVQLGSVTGTNTGTGSIKVLATLPPVFTQQPAPVSVYPGQTAQFTALAPNAVSYQWWFTNQANVGVQLTDGGGITGSLTDSLTIASVANSNGGPYVLVATDAGGSTSSSTAVLTVLTPGSPTTITTTGFEAQGTDWNTAASWSDDMAASLSIYATPGSTYEVVPGSLERSPVSVTAAFPGNVILLEGDGNLLDGNAPTFDTETTTGELRLKESGTTTAVNYGTTYTQGGSITFPDLQLNGGQLDNGSSSEVVIDGQIDVLANSSIYVDSAAAGSIRSYQVNAYLTGTGTLTYSYLTDDNWTNNDLIISCPSNIFSGQWNILQGALLGNAPNSLGTNSITIAPTGALETTYNLNSPNASLTLNGQMYLYTADTFYAVTVNGTQLSPGTYSFAQLNSAYPGNFPGTWPVQLGSVTGTNTGSGSLTILTGPASSSLPATIGTVSLSAGGNITLTGSGGAANGSYHVLTTTNLVVPLGNWAVVTNGSFDGSGNFTITFPVTVSDHQQFYAIRSP